MEEFLIEQFIEIREYLYEHIEEICSTYLTDVWDPFLKHILIKETKNIIKGQLEYDFPEFPPEYIPQIKLHVHDNELSIEAGVQMYLNTQRDMYFLGNIEHSGIEYDLYCQKSLDPYFDYIFYARYGHEENQYEMGSKEPAAQYMMGIMTPLSIAYSFAVYEGFIS